VVQHHELRLAGIKLKEAESSLEIGEAAVSHRGVAAAEVRHRATNITHAAASMLSR